MGYRRSTVSAGSKEQVLRVFNGYGRSPVTASSTTTMCESTVITRYGRGIVTAGSICEVTVITSYRSTQDDEHLCGETMTWNRACDSGLQVLEKHNYIHDTTYM